jgi:hypothetical protein
LIKPFCHQLLDVHLVHVQRRQRLSGERLYGGVITALGIGGEQSTLINAVAGRARPAFSGDRRTCSDRPL